MTEAFSRTFKAIQAEIAQVVVGQGEMVELMILSLLAKGHILLEGVPGLAKSLAAETFARVVGGTFKRFQFTPDKMPADITGTAMYNQKAGEFQYHPGPIFCNLFLADEINRASPKLQSALLQAMQERVVDAETERHPLPRPFMVLATQNPIEQSGTYPLSEAQTDRFMVKHQLIYPEPAEEKALMALKHSDFEERKARIRPLLSPETIVALQGRVHESVAVSHTVQDYLVRLCTATRPPETPPDAEPYRSIYPLIRLGASPRAAESLLALSKARAFCRGRDYVHFHDIQACALPVLRHRILLTPPAAAKGVCTDAILADLMKTVRCY